MPEIDRHIVLRASFERRARIAAAGLLFLAFAGYFLYDGYVAYPRANLKALWTTLNPQPPAPPRQEEHIRAELAGACKAGAPLEEATGLLGDPAWSQGDDFRWFGPAGSLQVVASAGTIRVAHWIPGPHDDVYLQRWIAYGLLAVGAGFLVKLLFVWGTRAVLDAEGLHVRGHRLIRIQDLAGLNAHAYPTEGWFDISVRHGDHLFSVRLDRYVYGDLDPMIHELRRRKHAHDGGTATQPG